MSTQFKILVIIKYNRLAHAVERSQKNTDV